MQNMTNQDCCGPNQGSFDLPGSNPPWAKPGCCCKQAFYPVDPASLGKILARQPVALKVVDGVSMVTHDVSDPGTMIGIAITDWQAADPDAGLPAASGNLGVWVSGEFNERLLVLPEGKTAEDVRVPLQHAGVRLFETINGGA